MKRAWLLVPLAVTLAAGGCGQKGPLYLPDKNARVVTAPAGSAPPATPPAPATAPAQPKATDKDQDSQPPPK
ncbi:MAG TPA: lipoprotein [Steroidobacteraceae bacterium]|nr:lipoprotein [Steroidobacteraceae bacterium]